MVGRRGITLIEMLVATGVFMLGFVGALSLFTAGVSYRKQSDDLTRTSLALTSLIEEIRIDAGRELGGPLPPLDYIGNGFAADGAEDEDYVAGTLFAYRMQPNIWYRVEACTDLSNPPRTDNATTTAIKLTLLIVPFATSDASVNLIDLGRQLQLRDTNDVLLTAPLDIANRLVDRGIALRHQVVMVRHRGW